MLDQPEEPSAGDDSRPPAKEEAFYVPALKPEPLSGKAPLPRVKRFSRTMLVIAGAVAGTVVTLAFWVGLQHQKGRAAAPPEQSLKPPAPGAAVSSLPSSYGDAAASVPQLGAPRPGDSGALGGIGAGPASLGDASGGAGATRQLTPLEQYQQQRLLERLKSEDQARGASAAFSGAGAGMGPGVASLSAAGGADAAAALSDRLLDVAQRSIAGSGGGGATSARDEDNRQDEKSSFAEKGRDSDFQLHHGIQYPRSPYTMFAGTIVPCVMMQGINSDLPGQIGCLVSQNVYDTVTGVHLLLPQGTKAIGTYDSRIAYGQSRVLVVWTRLLRPDGSAVSLEGMPGTDLSGFAGLTGHVNNHYARLVSGVVLGSIIGAAAQVGAGANNQNPAFSELAVQGAAQNINQAGQQITRKNLQIQPTIEVPPGARLNIFATKDIVLPPYSG
ncbi:MAG: TrbI/VirB10 family protein [Xanthobacteraceae bacterium]